MVNGPSSRIIYFGAWACVLLCVVGYIVLSVLEHAAPPELQTAMVAAFGVIAGAHVKPPVKGASE